MPSPEAFLSGFGLKRHLLIDDNQISSIKIKEKVIEKYSEYHFEIIITMKHEIKNSLIKNFREFFPSQKIIYSQYHNPYECHISKINIISDKELKMIGIAKRVYQK